MARDESLPIDKGWAWVITFASCGMFGFVTASFKNQGIILVELQELYPNNSVNQILWVFSMSTLSNRLSAPLNGVILTKTSHRTLGMFGVSLMSSGLIAFAFVPRVEYMYPVYGLVYGLGAGMVTLTTFTAYGPYFDKMKATSLGITAAGSGVMTMIVPNVLRALFDNFPFSSAMLLFTGLCLQLFIMASLLRPISFYEKFVKRETTIVENSHKDNDHSTEDDFRGRSYSMGAQTIQSNSPTTPFISTPDITKPSSYEHKPTPHITAYSIQDIAGSGAIFERQLTAPKSAAEDEVEKETKLNWTLVYNPQCLLLCLATLAYVSGLSVTYQCIPPLGNEAGVSKRFITIALAGAGALEIPMRIFHGWFADMKYISVYTHTMICMTFTGLMALLCAAISKHAGIVLMLIGVSSAGTSVISLLPIVNMHMLGKENLYSAMSMNYFSQGLALFVATFSSVAIYESTNRWENVFFYIGGCNITGALIMLITAAGTKCLHRHRNMKATQVDK